MSVEMNDQMRRLATGEEPPDTIIKHYVKQLMTSGRTDNEIVGDIEKYYHQLCNNCD